VLRTLRIGRAARGARLALAPWPVRALLVAWIALMVYAALAVWVVPATVPDVTRYHLPQAVAQVREGYIGMIPELDYRANHFPHGVQTLYAFAFLFTRDDRAMALTQIPISGLLWVAVAAMAARSCGIPRRWTLFTALLASFVGPVMLQMRAEMPDVGHAAGVIGAMVIATDPRRHFGRPWIALALAVNREKSKVPKEIYTMPITFPSRVCGTLSPYPTVVMVTAAHHRPSARFRMSRSEGLGCCRRSTSHTRVPESSSMKAIAPITRRKLKMRGFQ